MRRYLIWLAMPVPLGCGPVGHTPSELAWTDAPAELYGPAGVEFRFAVPEADERGWTVDWWLAEAPEASALWGRPLWGEDGTLSILPDRSGRYTLTAEVCAGPGECTELTTGADVHPVSRPPLPGLLARAETAPWVPLGTSVVLDGSGTDVIMGAGAMYWWSLKEVPSGSALTSDDLAGRSSTTASFVPDVPGLYACTLYTALSDNPSVWDTDKVWIQVGVGEIPPRAVWQPRTVLATVEFPALLDGSRSSAPACDSAEQSYRWVVRRKPWSSTVDNDSFEDRTALVTTFEADLAGTYVLGLVVECPNGGEGDPNPALFPLPLPGPLIDTTAAPAPHRDTLDRFWTVVDLDGEDTPLR